MQQYLDLLKAIKEKGTLKPAARANMPSTQSLFGYQFKCNLADGFPLLTTKKINFKHIVTELLWFLHGDTNIKFLLDNNCNIWNEDAYNYYLKLCYLNDIEHLIFNEFIYQCKNKEFSTGINDYNFGDCGYQYGKIWRKWQVEETDTYSQLDKYICVDQIKNLIEGLITNPQSRRHILTSIDPAHENDLALYWCHALTQFNCRPLDYEERRIYWLKNCSQKEQVELIDTYIFDKYNVPKYYLDCQMYQRSADVFLGVPYNIASYALLTEIFAKICNMIPGEFIHTFGDVHIYENHKEQVGVQLKRTPTKLPTLKINNDYWNLYNNGSDRQLCQIEINDFSLENYNSQSTIKGKLSTGLK